MKATRLILGVPLAAAITFGLFILMRSLISGPPADAVDYELTDPITISKIRVDSEVKKGTDTEEPIEKPDTEVEPPEPTKVEVEPVEGPGLLPANPVDEIEVEFEGTCGQPIVRVPPNYPTGPASREIEGFVVVRFTVTESGSVKDVHVVESEPPGVFDKAAKRAVSKWKYNPCKGADASKRYLEVVVSFDLE